MKDFLSNPSTELYHAIIEYNPDAILIVSMDGLIIEMNQAITKLFGYAKEELYGQSYERFIVAEELETANRNFLQTLKGHTSEFETTVRHKEKKLVRLKVKSDPLFVKTEIVGVICVAKDITEFNRTRTSLNQVEERLKFVFNSTGDSINLLDINGNVQAVNPAFETIFGWNQEDVIGKLLPVVPKSKLDDYHSLLKQVANGEEIIGKELRCIKKDGTSIEVSITLSAIRDELGNVTGYSGISRDITQQKQLGIALKASEERYRLIAENMTDMVCVIAWDGSFIYASPSHVTILGYPSNVYEGRFAREWMHKDDHPKVRAKLEETVATKKDCIFEYRFRDIHGNWIWLEGKAASVFNENGEFEHFLVVSRDIMERKMYEEKLSYLAYHDTLTGLPNRRMLKERLCLSLEQAEQQGHKLAIMFIDLDHFKYFNDSYGHDVGDELLKRFAGRVQNCLRDTDFLSRQGGDEFIVLLSDIKEDKEATQIAERIITSFEEPIFIDDLRLHSTCSIGISFYPNDGASRLELLKQADQFLYKAKVAGRNKFKCAIG